ncbi:MAG: beta-propeller domain-containing protein [Nanoarchaeota archaeon]
MSDKYLNIDLHDPRAAAIAEVLANKTCKKILDLLAEKEMSESDISNLLGIPLNTVGYNMKKLLESGLVVKTKTFFWSVKGKKIPTYRLANKKIVISPRRIPVAPLALTCGLLIAAFVLVSLMMQQQPIGHYNEDLKYFASYDELKKFLEESQSAGVSFGRDTRVSASTGPVAVASEKSDGFATAKTSSGADSYSQTNIQVQGVDEPDFVKNDGKYIYQIVGNKVVIVDAYPASKMNIVATIDINQSISQMFIENNTLVIFGEGYEYLPAIDTTSSSEEKMSASMIAPCYGRGCGGSSRSWTHVFVYDVSDRTSPRLKQNISVEGAYLGARMIGKNVYFVSNEYVSPLHPILPLYRMNGIEKSIDPREIGYFGIIDASYTFTSVAALSLNDGTLNLKTYLTGSTSTLYMSEDHLYLTAQKSFSQKEYLERVIKEVMIPLLPIEQQNKISEMVKNGFSRENSEAMSDVLRSYSESLKGEEKAQFDARIQNESQKFMQNIQKELLKTKIFKIAVKGNDISYRGSGEVPGRVLNQFSMDEFNGRFRIATTTGDVWNGKSLNHLYVLDSDLKIVGSVEDFAPGERIYSARFMGKRAYIVTFKKIDPFYVIDLSNDQPKVLGYLKIPGYSDYLHPYDENHVIGIGKNARGGGENFAWYQGMKVSLFDVSDVEHPVESAHLDIGDRGTDSPALHDHKAFLFDKQKNLLVLPILLAEVDKSKLQGQDLDSAYGTSVWQGAYVMHIDLHNITVKGKIIHVDDASLKKYKWNDEQFTIKRALTINDVLYTVSGGQIQAHTLENISEVGKVKLPYERFYPIGAYAVS